MIVIFLFLFAWYVVSMVGAALVNGDETDEDVRQSVRFGCVMAPLIISMMLLAFVEWHLRRFANYVGMPFIGRASDNPMDYLP